ncbi:MAG: MotB family protein [Gammaproteobacteria bacterium]
MVQSSSKHRKCPPVGAPSWMTTFADMMSLLLAFFVLLLSFSTMDVIRFKKIADSFKDSFGVQKEVQVFEVPLGVSVIAQHFSPAPTDPTTLDEVRQNVDQNAPTLDTPEQRAARLQALQLQVSELKALIVQAQREEIEAAANRIRIGLAQEIEAGLISVETRDLNIIIRINETGSFASGSAVLKAGFAPVMEKIGSSIYEIPGKILIGGHSDDIPIATDNYRSNWELSASRAVTVAHYLLQEQSIDPVRIEVEGHADTQPIVPNNSFENRAKNRRVEIIISRNND